MDKVKYDTTKAHQEYHTKDGTKVPGVTTVLNLRSKPQLLSWAWKCGRDGIDMNKARDKAADIGSIAHWLISCFLTGVAPDTGDFSPNDLSKAENAMIKFLSWWDNSGMKLVASERQMVSEVYGFGGTLDILATDRDGRMCLIDLKTSKAVYDEYWHQVAAYACLYNETSVGCDPIVRHIICRIGKDEAEGDFEVQERGNIAKQLRVFLAFLEAWKAIADCKEPKTKKTRKNA